MKVEQAKQVASKAIEELICAGRASEGEWWHRRGDEER
jgi:hypothetical protein